MHIDRLLALGAQRLADAASTSPRLDAEILLGFVLRRDRAWLYAWGDSDLEGFERARFEALIAARACGEPVAYLIGEREFWGLRLCTDNCTLIPRPDTECLVAAALDKAVSPTGRALDLGTGTGAIALAFASERPAWQVIGVDFQPGAVSLASHNAEQLAIANVEFLESDWFSALTGRTFDLVISNPPYLADDDPHLVVGDLRFEPRSALVAGDSGLADLHHLIASAGRYLSMDGWLILEHGMQQGEAVSAALSHAGFTEVATLNDLGGRPRVSLGRKVGP